MKVAGEPSLASLKIVNGEYGPYPENFEEVLGNLEEYFVLENEVENNLLISEFSISPWTLKKAREILKNFPETKKIVDRISKLIFGFESTFGLELLSLVHWIITVNGKRNVKEIISTVNNKNFRYSFLFKRQIVLAIEVLQFNNWTTLGLGEINQ
jgi:hypothetical protein